MLDSWHDLVSNDTDLTTSSHLSRTLFNVNIPKILDSFGCQLAAWPRPLDTWEQQEESNETTGHGLHRWHQGFRLRELTREWSHLQCCVMDEIEAYAVLQVDDGTKATVVAMRLWSQLCMTGVSDSSERFWQLQQVEAAGHIHDLEEAQNVVEQIEKSRAAEWHQAAHDLRGSLSVVSMATFMLSDDRLEEQQRVNSTAILQRSVNSLQDMLNNLIGLARLGAGRETRSIARFDAATFLRDLCGMMQPIAQDRGLTLRGEGPLSLPVEGDSVKIQRILQNLILNSVKYTERGGIVLTWEMSQETGVLQWMVSVQDTGPGLPDGAGNSTPNRLQQALSRTYEEEESATAKGTFPNGDGPVETVSSRIRTRPVPAHSVPAHPQPPIGEGIGLSIVKGLCLLLDATLEVHSEADQGSTFRVKFPVCYSGDAAHQSHSAC